MFLISLIYLLMFTLPLKTQISSVTFFSNILQQALKASATGSMFLRVPENYNL